VAGGLRKLRETAHESSADAENVEVQSWIAKLQAAARKGAEL